MHLQLLNGIRYESLHSLLTSPGQISLLRCHRSNPSPRYMNFHLEGVVCANILEHLSIHLQFHLKFQIYHENPKCRKAILGSILPPKPHRVLSEQQRHRRERRLTLLRSQQALPQQPQHHIQGLPAVHVPTL